MRKAKFAGHSPKDRVDGAAPPAEEAGAPAVAFTRGLWRAAHVALRARRQVLEGKAPPEVLGAMGWPVPWRG